MGPVSGDRALPTTTLTKKLLGISHTESYVSACGPLMEKT